MTALPAVAYISDNARTQGQIKQALEDVRDVISELMGGAAEGALVIASDAVTPTVRAGQYTVDTEAAASTDDLKTITATNTPNGRTILLRILNSARTVRIFNAGGGAGQILTADAAHYTLRDTKDFIILKYNSALSPAGWEEVVRSRTKDFNEIIGALEESTLTIATGAVTATRAIHEIDTEAAGATDDLDNILQTGTNGTLLLIHSVAAARVVTVRHNQGTNGKILTASGSSIVLDDPNKFILLMKKGTTWEEVAQFGFTSTAGVTIETKTTTFTAGTGLRIYRCDTSGAAFTATLPTLASAGTNTQITFKLEVAGNDLTIDGNGAEEIETSGQLTVVLSQVGDCVTLYPGVTRWQVVA